MTYPVRVGPFVAHLLAGPGVRIDVDVSKNRIDAGNIWVHDHSLADLASLIAKLRAATKPKK